MYEIIVVDEPRPRPRGEPSPAAAATASASEGTEDADLSERPVWSAFTGRGGVVSALGEGSAVHDLRVAAGGLGEMIGGGEGVDAALCQRSKTGADLRPPELEGVSFRSGGGLPTESWAVAWTMLFTKPRPCRRLILGVGSFGGGARRNAGEGFKEAGSCGPREVRGDGWIGRARDGVLMEALGDEDIVGEDGACVRVADEGRGEEDTGGGVYVDFKGV